jgi:hypothetical protein
MNHEPDELQDEDGYDDVLGRFEDAPPVDEHRLSTSPGTVGE